MKIVIEKVLMDKIRALVLSTPEEFTLMGKTKLVDGNIELIDFRIPKQSSNASTTEVSASQIIDFVNELDDVGENPAEWNMWIHSHNTMGVFWSGQDLKQMEEFNMGPAWFAHLVVNTTTQRGAVTQYKPFAIGNEDVPVEIVDTIVPTDEELEQVAAWNDEYLALRDKHVEIYEQMQELEAKISGKDKYAAETAALLAELAEKNEPIVYKYKDWKKNKWSNTRQMWDAEEEEADPIMSEGYYKATEDLDVLQARIDKLTQATIAHQYECGCRKCDRLKLLSRWLAVANIE